MVCGGISETFWLLVLGRGLFGIGSETMLVLSATYVTDWFFD
jgi:MFS family permease